MIAPLGTLAFLATLWLLVVVGATVLEESGAKIVAALKGKHRHSQAFVTAPIRLRTRVWTRNPMCATPRLRDAA